MACVKVSWVDAHCFMTNIIVLQCHAFEDFWVRFLKHVHVGRFYMDNYKATETSTQSVTGHAKRALKSLLRRTSWARMQSCGSMTDDVIRRRQTQLWPTIVQLFIANKPIQTSAQKQRLKATGCCLKKLKITQKGSSSERSESNGVSIHNISVGSITAQGTCILPLRCSRLEFVF